jgi:hypothetical protein
MTKETGGSAFPVPQAESVHCRGEIVQYAESGMTLRDWFAAMALQGMLSGKPAPYGVMLSEHPNVADTAYKFADAMIAERNKP